MKNKSKKSKASEDKMASKNGKSSVKNTVQTSVKSNVRKLSAKLPKLSSVKKLEKRGSKLLETATAKVASARESLSVGYKGAAEGIKSTQRKVAKTIKERPIATTAAAAAIGAVGVGLLANKLVSRKTR